MQAQDGDSVTFGALILQSSVQAVASINEIGAYLVIPGQDLSWNRIRPGTYRVLISAGSQQWKQTVQIKAGETSTLVAALNSLGPPLSAAAPPFAPSAAIPATTTGGRTTSPTTTVQHQELEQAEERQDEARQRLIGQERALRATQENDRRLQEAEDRAQREADRKETDKNQSKRPKRPRML